MFLYLLAFLKNDTLFENEIRSLYEKYGGIVFRKARRIVGTQTEADDVMQDVFFKLMENYHKIRNKEYMSSWIYRTTVSTAIDAVRKRKDQVEIPEGLPMKTLSIEGKVINRETINRLPKKLSEIMVCCFLEEMTQEETAKFLNISRPGVQKRLKKLDELLEGQQNERN